MICSKNQPRLFNQIQIFEIFVNKHNANYFISQNDVGNGIAPSMEK